MSDTNVTAPKRSVIVKLVRQHVAPPPVLLAFMLTLAACTNNPYPDADATRKILYMPYVNAPRSLDPAVAYSTADHEITGPVFETLLEYHYLERPYTLIPALATQVPRARHLPGGRVAYDFLLRSGALYQDDACFSLGEKGRSTRPVSAADVAFALARLADPAVNSPVVETFGRIVGFPELTRRLTRQRKEDPSFASLRPDQQYARLGGIEGVRVLGDTQIQIILTEPYPQIVYWFAMPFTAPVPWEAVAYYDGQAGRDNFADHPVGAGPFRVALYDRRSRIVLERNENWYGLRHPEWRAPGTLYPGAGTTHAGAAAGRQLPFVERIELRRDPEPVPSFVKFLQGYYDLSSVSRESFDQVMHEGSLSAGMAARGMRLEKSVTPAVYYLGFNMDDPVVGAAAGDRGRALRQAMSLAVDAREFGRLFLNGRGIPAQFPVPPGIFGYEENYENPFRQVNLKRASHRLAEAGYARGLDPKSGKPLRLTFDIGDTSARSLIQFQFFVGAWRRLGLDVEIRATDYNQFQDKVRRGAYQIFWWGWVADYPDPENFLFLLYGPMGRRASGGPNTANFADPRYDALFSRMKARENDPERLAIILEMRSILERERPWIEVFHPEDYILHHGWIENVKAPGLSLPTDKYYDIDQARRDELRRQWNRPVRWPAAVLALLLAASLAPAVVRVVRERGR